MHYYISKTTFQVWLLLFVLVLTRYGFAQIESLDVQLQILLEGKNTSLAEKLLAKGFQSNYFLFVNCDDPAVDGVEVQVIEAGKLLGKYRRRLPYLEIRDSTNKNIELAFTLTKGTQRIDIIDAYRLGECSNGHWGYLTLHKIGTKELKNCLKIHPPPPKYDTLYIKLPPRKFFNYRVLSSGAVAAASFFWFGYEFFKTKDDFKRYERAVETAEVVKLRGEVQKSRTRRNIAGALFLVSGATFTYFLANPEREIELDCKKRGTTGSSEKLHFRLEPSFATNEVQIALSLNF